ncbi:MAG: efflux RND transporter permease subunit [Gammaproteobacteria bacterium]|nr:efflux RND transporter permease subunit [Gammaproteobacteria bacterium]
MFLPRISIQRPVLATVMSLLLVLIGVISYQRLSVREYPKIDIPVVSVRTVYKGASAEIIESQVTKPLEDSLAGIEGIRTIKSSSREEVSQITVEFILERDPDEAANDVRDRVARVRGVLPDAADEPVVSKIDADANAIIWIAFSSERHDAMEITDYARRHVIDRLQVLPGVASVIIGGERQYAMRIWLDRNRLAAYQLTPLDVENALSNQNLEIPSGRIESQQREFTVLMKTDLQTPEQFNNIIIRNVNGYPVRLQDVGNAELGAADERNAVRVNGNPAVGLGIVKQSTANTLQVGRAVKAELPKINASLPAGMKLKVAFDTSLFIDESINSVYHAIAEALVLVVLVIFFFLRSWRATLIPFVTIPVSLIGAFVFLYAMHFSINILTLLGLVLAIGLVVDDAIVILENIHRRIEHGMRPFEAAMQGSSEIAFAVVAMTLTLAAVFAPLAFITGNTGRLFSEFALTVAGAVLVSGFVALSLTPMMCSKLLHHEKQHGRFYVAIETGLHQLNEFYRRNLGRALHHRTWILATCIAIAVSVTALMGWLLRSELAPVEDRGILIGFMLGPEGSTLNYMDKYAKQVEQFYSKIPEVNTYFMVLAPGLEKPNPVNLALSFVSFKPWSERTRSEHEIASSLNPLIFGLPGVFGFLIEPPSLGQNFRNQPLQFVVQANDYKSLDGAVTKLLAKARANPGLVAVDSDLKLNKPQLAVDVHRDKISDLDLDVASVGHTLETLLGGRQVTRFKRDGEQYDVIVKLADDDRRTPRDLSSIYVRSNNNNLVQLANLVNLRETVAPKELNHFDRFRAATISAGLAPNYSLGEALKFMQQAAKDIVPADMQTSLDGQSREFSESGAALYVIFLLALIFIYLVLAAQFESFIDPLVIMLTVPMAVTGALLMLKLSDSGLHYSGGTLNVYSKVGLVMLVGLITKHGILIVAFANQLREQGKSAIDAVTEAAVLRLRPILMTTAAMVLGAIPLAFAHGAGAESRQPIGMVIVGGLLLGTLLTLFVVPTAYTLLSRRRTPTGTEKS